MNFTHRPVLLTETINSLNIKPDGIYVDGTAGGGGHSYEIAKKLTTGRLICIDQDPDAIETCKKRFFDNPNVTVYKSNYSNIKNVLFDLKIDKVDGVLMDIGVSSHQLDCAERGFSYHKDAPLDMRMSQSGKSAADIVNTYSWQSLAEIFSRYGEEKFSASIAKAIVKEREKKSIETTFELADIISASVPAAAKRGGHPARKVFQALRIEVNGELDVLEKGMDDAFDLLNKDGRLAIITFHSLEARIVKTKMAKWCEGCTCPKEFPVCICGNTPKAKLLNKKPIVPSCGELELNPRSRSSELRVCIKL